MAVLGINNSMLQPKSHMQPEALHYISRGALTGAVHMQPSLWSLTLITMLQYSMKVYDKDFYNPEFNHHD